MNPSFQRESGQEDDPWDDISIRSESAPCTEVLEVSPLDKLAVEATNSPETEVPDPLPLSVDVPEESRGRSISPKKSDRSPKVRPWKKSGSYGERRFPFFSCYLFVYSFSSGGSREKRVKRNPNNPSQSGEGKKRRSGRDSRHPSTSSKY